LGLKFANIIHWPKLTIVGIASVPVKILRTNEWQYWKMPLSTAALLVWCPIYDATLVNIRIKLILSERLHFCRW